MLQRVGRAVASVLTGLVLLSPSIVSAGPIISNGIEYHKFNGHYYGLTDQAYNWIEAEAYAVGLGGHLVAINSSQEQSFLESLIVSGDFFDYALWIGLSDAAIEGQFVWSTGESLTYMKWKGGEPNNDGPGEDYVAMNWEHLRGGPLGTWNDAPLAGNSGTHGAGTAGPYYGIVELTSLPIAAVPEPGTLGSRANNTVTINCSGSV